MEYQVLAFTSWTPPTPGGGILDEVPQHYIMAVAIKTMLGWKAYIGFALNERSADENAQHIAGTGVKLARNEALGIFPHLKSKDLIF